MRYIPLFDNKPDDEWVKTAKEKFEELKSLEEDKREDFIDKNDQIWGSLKDFLSSLSDGKCWYSESRDTYTHYHVDHFRPKNRVDDRIDFSKKCEEYKKGYWWLAFYWKNYRFCGAVGNVNKRDKFAVKNHKANSIDDPYEDELQYLIDPTHIEDIELLTVDETGKIISSNQDESSWDYKRAEYTIKVLKLNDHDPLIEGRRIIWKYCNRLLSEIVELKAKQNKSPSTNTKTKINEKIKELKKLQDSQEEFTMTIQSCIENFKKQKV